MTDPKLYTEEEVAVIQSERDALKGKHNELLTETKNAKAALKAYEGIDPAKAKALQKAAEDAEAAAAAARGDFSTREKQLIERHTQELEKRTTRETKLQRAVERRTAEAEIRRAIAAAGGNAELLLPHAMPYVKVRETDDDFEAILEEHGQPLVADGKGSPMTFDTFVSERLKTKFPDAFAGTGSSGGGASKSIASGVGGRIIPAGATWTKADIDDIASGKAQVR